MSLGLGYGQKFQIQTHTGVISQEWYTYFIILKRIYFLFPFHNVTSLEEYEKYWIGADFEEPTEAISSDSEDTAVHHKQKKNQIKFGQATASIQTHLTMIANTTVWEMHIFVATVK
jgi:hypothetical protein